MVSGQPPRHSKSDKPSVIIDLDAEPATDSAPDRAPAAPETGTDARPDDTPPETATPGEVPPSADMPDSSAPATEPEPPMAAAAPAPRGPHASTLVATGIIGGLVALSAAGAMQYAGYLPALAPAGTTATAPADAVSRADFEALKAELAARPAAAGAADPALAERLTAVETALAELKAAPAAGQPAVTALEEKLAALSRQLADLDTQLTSKPDAAALAGLETRLSETEKTLAEPRDDVAVAEAIAASSLKAAAERGGPFVTELDTLAAMRPDDPAIARLKDHAATGVATRADLQERFPATAAAMIDATEATAPDAGVIDRLWGSARKLVSVRPVGNVPGTDPASVIARIEDKLKNGDLKGATLEWDALPPAARTAGADLRSALDARLAVDDLTAGLVAATVAKTRQTQ